MSGAQPPGKGPQKSRPANLNLNLGASSAVPSPTTTPTTPTRGQRFFPQGPDSPRLPRATIPIYKDNLPLSEKLNILKLIGPQINKNVEKGLGFCLITGPTGSGKSTICVLAYLLENLWILRETGRKIYLIEPRRIAALDLYNRLVSMGGPLNLHKDLFGLKMMNRDINSKKATLVICTAGYLFMQLMYHPAHFYTAFAFIADEVHEMDKDTEVVLALISLFNFAHYKKQGNVPTSATTTLKDAKRLPYLLLMSATLNLDDLYMHYRPPVFYQQHSRKLRPVVEDVTFDLGPGMNSGLSLKKMYLDELASMHIDTTTAQGHILQKGKWSFPELHESVIGNMFDAINAIYTLEPYKKFRGGLILMCIPGEEEITRCFKYYKKHDDEICVPLTLIKYHSNMTPDELLRARQLAADESDETVKVMLATSIADSSLTLPNCSVVLDSGLIKKPLLNTATRKMILRKCWIDYFRRMQREGRTARLRDGLYILFVPRLFYSDENLSDLCRINVEEVFVRAMKLAEMDFGVKIDGIVTKFFTTFLFSKPPARHLNSAIQGLLNDGQIVRKRVSDLASLMYDGYGFTVLGKVAGTLEVDANITRACVLASALGAVQGIAVLASEQMEVKGQLFQNGTKSLKLLHFLERHSCYFTSDFFATFSVFRVWLLSKATTRYDGGQKKSLKWIPRGENPGFEEDLTDEEFHVCNHSFFDKMDDNYVMLIQSLVEGGVYPKTGIMHTAAGQNPARKRLATIDLMQQQLFALLLTTPAHAHYLTTPGYWFSTGSYEGVSLLNSVFLRPAPSESAKIEEWGYQVMRMFSGPRNVYPDVRVDHKNNFVIVSWKPYGQDMYQGMINWSVKDALVKSEMGKIYNIYYFVNEGKDNQPSSSSATKLETLQVTTTKNDASKIPKIIFNAGDKFLVIDPIDPHHLGVRRLVKDIKYTKMMQKLLTVRHKFVPLQIEDVQMEQKVIYTASRKEDKTTEWNEKCSRGIIAASIFPENLAGLTQYNKDRLKVLIELIDLGITIYAPQNTLSYFDSDNCNYGMPELFEHPRKGFRLMISSLQPYIHHQHQWSSIAKKGIIDALNDRKDFGNIVTLTIQHVDQYDNIIVASDMKSEDTGKSFVDLCLQRSYASPLVDTLLTDMTDREENSQFMRRITRTGSLLEQEELFGKLKKAFDNKEEGIANLEFVEMFSPLQADLKAIGDDDEKSEMTLKPTPNSINCSPIDFRLACTSLTKEKYDPLLAVGMDTRAQTYSKDNQATVNLLAEKVTITNPLQGVAALVEMCTYPFVELLYTSYMKDAKNPVPFATRLYSKTLSGGLEYRAFMFFKVKFTPTDVDEIEKLRSMLNAIHVKEDYKPQVQKFAQLVTDLMQRERLPLDFATPLKDDLEQRPPMPAIGDNYMIFKIVKTFQTNPVPAMAQ